MAIKKEKIQKTGATPPATPSSPAAPTIMSLRGQGIKKSAATGTIGGGASLTSSMFYTPELTPESWLLPKSRTELIKWCRIFFNLEAYIQSIIMMHARYPFSKFSISVADPDVQNFYEEMIENNDWSLYETILKASLSWWLYGEAIPFGNWDEKNKKWKRFVLLEPEVVEVHQDIYDEQPSFELIPTEELRKIINNPSPENLKKKEKYPEQVIKAVASGKNIALDSKAVSIIARTTSPSAIRGTPIMQCVTGDTLVLLTSGKTISIQELHENKTTNFEVYCIDEKDKINKSIGDKVVLSRKNAEIVKLTLSNGKTLKCTPDHRIILANGSWVQAQNIKPQDEFFSVTKRGVFGPKLKVVKMESAGTADVYDIREVAKHHNFSLDCGLFVHNCVLKALIYQDMIRMAQMKIAERHQLPIELWTYGSLEHKILPTDQDLVDFKNMINQAVMNPPFVMVYPPIVDYKVLGVKDKLLNLYDDYAYVQDQILVGLGVNKNLILGEGPSFSNVKTMSLHRLVMDYQTLRDSFEKWIINKVFRRVAEENGFYYYKGKHKKLMLPEIHWQKSLDIEGEESQRKLFLDMWKEGILSTETLMTKFPSLKLDTEKQRLEKEIGTIYDKKDGRLPKEFKPGEVPSPLSTQPLMPKPSEFPSSEEPSFEAPPMMETPPTEPFPLTPPSSETMAAPVVPPAPPTPGPLSK